MVIAIIGLLAALLLPALKTARDRGKSAVCLSNQRQLTVAVLMYGDDNSGWVPGADWDPLNPSYQPGGWEVSFRGFWYTGGSLFWNDKRQTQQQLRPYVNVFSPVWMCPGWSLDELIFPTNVTTVVGTPLNNTSVEMPYTMRNIGFGYEYRPWLQKTMGWPPGSGGVPGGSYSFQLRLSGPGKPQCANLFNCLVNEYWDPAVTRAPHNKRNRWNVSYLDGSVRSTTGSSEGNWAVWYNMPPDANSVNWGP